MPDTLYLVDATYELYRSFFAIKGLTSPDGQNVGATYGLLNTMVSLIDDEGVEWIGCATDTTITSWRNALFDGYKSGDDVPEDLLAQFELAERGLRSLGLRVWPMDEFEADDAVATAAARFADTFDEIVICSPDKDFAQCVRGTHTVMWDRRRETRYDEEGVMEKWGVAPASIPSWLALVGDSADGLPGVPRWGPKSTSTVLRVYGTVGEIPTDPEDWEVKVRGKRGLSENLEAHREDALLYEKLATLRTDADVVDATAEPLRWEGVDMDDFTAFCDELGFGRIQDRARALGS